MATMDLREACALLDVCDDPLPDDEVIKKAFRKAALKAHPDKGGSDDEFRRVKEASEVIVRAKTRGVRRAGDAADVCDAPDAESFDDDEDEFANFFDDGSNDGVMAEIIMRMYEMETGQSISGKRRRLIEKSIRNMRKSEKLKKAQREADAKKARARAARDAEEQAFWERQYAAGSRSLQEGGRGCYLAWDPRALQRELQSRRLKPPRPSTVKTLATKLLEDDERKAAAGLQGETSLVAPGAAATPSPAQRRRAPESFRRPEDKIADARRKRAQERAAAEAAARAERERTEAMIMGAVLATVGILFWLFVLSWLTGIGFWTLVGWSIVAGGAVAAYGLDRDKVAAKLAGLMGK